MPFLKTMRTLTPLLPPPPRDKRAFGKAVGDQLLKRHGKKRSYDLYEIADVIDFLELPFDLARWAYAAFAAPEDIKAYQALTRETFDYTAMKSEMFSAMTEGASDTWFDFDMSWLEWPDFDFGSLFDFFDLG